MYSSRSNQKPPLGTLPNVEHPLWPCVDLCLPFLEGQGSNPWEFTRGVGLTTVGTKPGWKQGPLGGLAPVFPSTSGGWSIAGPGQYTTQNFTIAFWLYAPSTAGMTIFGTGGGYKTSGYQVQLNGGQNNLTYRCNTSGSASDFYSATNSLVAGVWQHWTVVRSGGGVSFYLNGAFSALSYGTGGGPTPTAPGGNTLWINCYPGGGTGGGSSGAIGLDNVLMFGGLALTAAQVADLYNRQWQMFDRRPSLAGVPTITPTIFASPSMLYANGGSQTLALTGYDRVWTPSSTTTFSLSSKPAGVGISTQLVSDAAHASVTLTTGSTAGTASITDGTATINVPVQPVSFAATPAAIPAHHSGPLTLTLTGAGTPWTGGTTFAVSGVPGASKVSQSVASNTSATIVVTTGSGTGTLTISDGTRTATIAVATETLAASSTTSLVATGTYSIALTATNAAWTQETLSSLFSLSGISGATISNPQRADDNHASLTVSLGNATGGGTLTVTDTSTGATATLPVTAVPSGSLHATGQAVLAHTGGATGAFGNKTAATLMVRAKALSNAGLGPSGGTAVVGWGTNAYGGSPLLTYNPAAGTWTFTAYFGNSSGSAQGTFAATIPAQIGTGYHFLLSCSVAAQPSVTATLTSGNQVIAITSGSNQLQVGDLVAGTGIYPGTTVQWVQDSTHYGLNIAAQASGTSTLSVTRGSQVLYLNGVPYSTAAIPYATFPYQNIQAGGNAGSGIALDHLVEDLAAWGGYAASSADALALANGSTPLQVGSPSYWFPLAGGTVGTVPTLADQWLSDYTGNGNALTLASGSLSNLGYGAAVGLSSPVLMSAYVKKCGKTAFFGTTGAAPAANGQHPLAAVTAVNGTPTIRRNGTAVQIGPATWTSSTKDMAGVAYLLQCGGVDRIAIQSGGSNYSSTPTASASGGGGSGLVLGTPTVQTGVTGYTVTAAGSGFAQPPAVNFSGGGGSGAAGYAIVWGNGVTDVIITAGGTGYTSAPTISFSGGGGSGASATAIISGGAVTGAKINGQGSGYNNPPSVSVGAPSASTAGQNGAVTASARAIVYDSNAGASAGKIRAVVPYAGGLLGCGTGYDAAHPPTVTLSGATITPVVSGYIASVPVTSPGGGYTSPPTITISDATGAGATVVPIMTGVSPGDTMTYDAPAGWLTASLGGNSLGGIQAASGAPMDNWTGQREGVSGGLTAFAQTPALAAGGNVGADAAAPGWTMFTAKNRIHQGGGWTATTANLTTDLGTYTTPGLDGNHPSALGTPVSWTNPTTVNLYQWLYGPNGTNEIDSMGWAGQFGQWTLQYDDPGVNGTGAMWLTLSGGGTCTPVGQSGSGASVTATVSGGVLTGFTGLVGGSGYQGAIVVLRGGGGSGAAVTVNVVGGAVTGFNILKPGSGYTSPPTATIYGTSVAGTAVRMVYDMEPAASPTTWQVNATVNVAAPNVNGRGYWTISNLWVVAPDAVTRQAVASIDKTKPFATDDGVLASFTSPTGRSIGVLRFMDVTLGYAGASNFILPSDLQDPTNANWEIQRSLQPWFQYARYYNTDPNNSTYAWSSTRIYGAQAYFTQQDTPFTVTGNLTSGSKSITGLSGTALMVGSTVSGAGIPAGAYIAAVTGSTTATLSAPAASSGTGVSLTVRNPNYITLPPGDAGLYVAKDNSYKLGVVELRSTTPHGLQTGQRGDFYSTTAANAITWTNATPYSPTVLNGGMIWVTGPYTVAVAFYIPSNLFANAPASSRPQTVASTTEIDLTLGGATTGWLVTVKVPTANAVVPWEYAFAFVGQLPGCAGWFSLPPSASDALIQHLGTVAAQYVGPTNALYLEYGNELWNSGANSLYEYPNSVSQLLSYATPGTTLLGNYVADAQYPPYDVYGSGVVLGEHAYAVFQAAFVAAGGSASQIHRVHGSWYNGYYRTQQILETAQRWGIGVDHVAVAPYYYLPSDLPIVTAFSPAGSPINNAGSWPMDAMNDLCRHWMPYSASNQAYWGGHQAACLSFGQPMNPAGFSNTNATATARLTPTTVASVAIGNAGSNYSSNAVATVVGGGGSGVSTSVTVSSGAVTGVTVNGTFTSVPTILINDPPGSGATATAVGSGSTVTVTVTNGGSGFRNPKATLTGGGGSYTSTTVTQSGGVVTGVTVSGAAGYTGNPSVLIYDSVGSGASVTVTLTPTSVASIVPTSPGVGYVVAPTVALSGGGGSGASFTAGTPVGGQITSYTQSSGGSGYTSPPTVTITGGAGSNGLAGAVYRCCYTFSDSAGRETTVGLSRASLGISNGDLPTLGMPAWPSWAQSINIYLGSGASGTETLYATYTRGQYGYGNAYPVGAKIPLATKTWSNPSKTAPTTNLAAANVTATPTVTCYEGGATYPVPGGIPFQKQLLHDSACHPSARDMAWGWYATTQLGSQTIAGGCCTASCYYQIYSPTNYDSGQWVLAYGTAQPAGDGLAYAYSGSTQVPVPANRYATIQGGLPADGHNHVGGTPGNTSPLLQGLRDWIDVASPLPANPSPATGRRRRWFAGLGQNAMRLAR